jgi:hypothetical protein
MRNSERELQGNRKKPETIEDLPGLSDVHLERLRKNFYHLWKVLKEVEADPSLPERWRRAPRGSVGWRSLIFYEKAKAVLEVSGRNR